MSEYDPTKIPDDPRGEIVAEWLEIAEGDFELAQRERSRRDDPNLRAIAFHYQQAIEKLMKGLLIRKMVKTPKTHDLKVLAMLLEQVGVRLQASDADLGALTDGAVDSRYPGFDLSRSTIEDLARVAESIWSQLRPLL